MRKIKGVVGFFLAFLVSLLILAGLSVALWNAEKVVKGAAKPESKEGAPLLPRGNVLAVLKGFESCGNAFLLLGFDKEECLVNIMALPPDLLVPTALLTDVLEGQYSYGGALYCRQAVEYTFGVAVDRVAEVSAEAVEEMVDGFGGITLDLPRDVVVETGGMRVEFKAGRQTVSGRVVAKLLEDILRIEDWQVMQGELTDFAAQVLREFGPRVLAKDSAFRLLTNCLIADITYRDFAENKKAFANFLSMAEKDFARPLCLEGEKRDGAHFFDVAPKGREALIRYFG